MRLRTFIALACLLSIAVELAFDNTNSFVRVSAAPSVDTALIVDSSNGDDQERGEIKVEATNQSSEVSQRDGTPLKHGKATVLYSLGHYAGPATYFVPFIPKSVNRFEPQYVWNYRDIDRLIHLRPPILRS